MKRPPRLPELSSPPFRLRALWLAFAALLVGLSALVLALTSREREGFRLSPRDAGQAWPEGFVEIEGSALPLPLGPAPSAAPSASVAPSAQR